MECKYEKKFLMRIYVFCLSGCAVEQREVQEDSNCAVVDVQLSTETMTDTEKESAHDAYLVQLLQDELEKSDQIEDVSISIDNFPAVNVNVVLSDKNADDCAELEKQLNGYVAGFFEKDVEVHIEIK